MQIGILSEPTDQRVALVPEVIKQLIGGNNQVLVESGAGDQSYISDQDYIESGAKVTNSTEIFGSSELIISINKLPLESYDQLQDGTAVISSFQPFNDVIISKELSIRNLTVFSMDMVPRITLAQAMDVLSSMASIAGYQAVLQAATHLPRYFPMLTTAAGTIPPAKVLVLGAGVAGLQAIATAKRLGGVVEAFDTRLAAKEEVESLGAKFVMVEGATDDKAAGGYAVEQSEDYKQKQQALIQEKAEKADVIITTAQLRGKPAPLLVTEATVKLMKPGAVIVDLAASTGGNCELTRNNETIQVHAVTIIGNSDLAQNVPMHASQLYSKNIFNFLKVLITDEGKLNLDLENEILKSSCIAHAGQDLFNRSMNSDR
ncbi:MAG: NAD(P) transhydrogenase subunit alpha [Cyclobacteriaceae bacterium]|nr:MAG: NAD(P) transhydrogenase subunit alpha [Cyclobacteriaceae bacterium]